MVAAITDCELFAPPDSARSRDSAASAFPGSSKLEWTFVVNAWIVSCLLGSHAEVRLQDGSHGQLHHHDRRRCGPDERAGALGLRPRPSDHEPRLRHRYGHDRRLHQRNIAPHMRGKLVSWMQISINSGILMVVVAFFFGNTSSGWRYITGFPIVLAVLFLGMSPFFMVESPARLLSVGKHAQAEAEIVAQENVSVALSWMIDNESSSDIETLHLGSQDTEATQELAAPQATLLVLLSPMFRRQLVVTVGVAIAQQLSGINVLFYYHVVLVQYRRRRWHLGRPSRKSDRRHYASPADLRGRISTLSLRQPQAHAGVLRFAGAGMTISQVVDVSELTVLFMALYVAAFAFGALDRNGRHVPGHDACDCCVTVHRNQLTLQSRGGRVLSWMR